jgi:hypothetical protein
MVEAMAEEEDMEVKLVEGQDLGVMVVEEDTEVKLAEVEVMVEGMEVMVEEHMEARVDMVYIEEVTED